MIPPATLVPIDILADHFRCKLHQDYENRRKICNAQTYAKARCKYKVFEPVDGDLWESGYLPVCSKHRYSRVSRGSCQAIAKCGHKCLRPVAFVPGCTQLCSRHKDEPQECHISQLPTELRLQIFELLIPAGVVPAKATHAYDPHTHTLKLEKKYSTAASLMRVDKQTCADVEALLYQCPTRPFEFEVSATSIAFGKLAWHDDPSALVGSSHTSRHVNMLSKCRLDRIRHVKIKIFANRTAAQMLYALLVNIRKLRQALQVESVTEEIPAGTSTASNLTKLGIEMVYNEYEPTEDVEFYPSEIFAFSRLVLQFFRNLPVSPKWSIEWNIERTRRYYPHPPNNTPKKSKMTMTKTKGTVKNMKIDKENFDSEATKFRSWARRFNSKTTNTLLVSTWQQFQELETIVIDLMNLKILRDDAGHASFMHNARIALETRDSEVLDSMKAQLREVSRKYVAEKMILLQKVEQKFLLTDTAEDEFHDPDEVLYDPTSFVSWPPTTAKRVRFGKPTNIVGGTLEEHVDGVRTVYQLITPDLVG